MPESPTTPKASSKPLAPLGTPERARKRRSSATQKIVAAAEVVKPFVPHWPWKLPWWLNYVLSILAVVLPLLVVGSVFLIGISNSAVLTQVSEGEHAFYHQLGNNTQISTTGASSSADLVVLLAPLGVRQKPTVAAKGATRSSAATGTASTSGSKRSGASSSTSVVARLAALTKKAVQDGVEINFCGNASGKSYPPRHRRDACASTRRTR